MTGRSRETPERVVEAVADHADVDPLELPPLYESVDPDALDALVAGLSDGEVRFRHAGRVVVVDHEGTVTVEGDPAGTADGGARSTAEPTDE